MNLIDINNFIKNLSLGYPTIQEYENGDVYEYMNSSEHKYPTIFLTISSISSNDEITNISATLFYIDRLLKDNSNRLEIQAYGNKALKAILEKATEWSIINFDTITYTPFTEKFADLCAGVFAQFNIQINDELDCSSYEGLTLDIKEDGLYNVLGYEQVLVDVTKVRSINGHSGDITLGKGLTINDNNVLSGVDPTFTPGDNISITHTGDDYRFDVPDMRYDDSEVKGMIDDLAEEISSLNDVTIPEIVPTTTNFTSGSKWTITTAFERVANLFAGYWNYIQNSIMNLIPAQASSSNQLADKSFVNETVAQNAANFRGNWATWADVPNDRNLYPIDYAGNRKPTNNDYMVVTDASGYIDPTRRDNIINVKRNTVDAWTITVDFGDRQINCNWIDYNHTAHPSGVSISPTYKLKYVGGNPGNWYIISNKAFMIDGVPKQINADILLITTAEIDVTKIVYTYEAGGYDGSWRFLYTGDWSTLGKSGWSPAYRIGSAFTDAQQAAIDSTITADKVSTYDSYEARIGANETNKVDKINTANKIYGTATDGTQTEYIAGTGINFVEITHTDSEGVITKTHEIQAQGYTKTITKEGPNIQLVANEYTIATVDSDITITLDTINILADGVNEYRLQLTVNAPIQITFNISDLKWSYDVPDYLVNGKTYEISIINKHATYLVF